MIIRRCTVVISVVLAAGAAAAPARATGVPAGHSRHCAQVDVQTPVQAIGTGGQRCVRTPVPGPHHSNICVRDVTVAGVGAIVCADPGTILQIPERPGIPPISVGGTR